jgi:hypothetical protein
MDANEVIVTALAVIAAVVAIGASSVGYSPDLSSGIPDSATRKAVQVSGLSGQVVKAPTVPCLCGRAAEVL